VTNLLCRPISEESGRLELGEVVIDLWRLSLTVIYPL